MHSGNISAQLFYQQRLHYIFVATSKHNSFMNASKPGNKDNLRPNKKFIFRFSTGEPPVQLENDNYTSAAEGRYMQRSRKKTDSGRLPALSAIHTF